MFLFSSIGYLSRKAVRTKLQEEMRATEEIEKSTPREFIRIMDGHDSGKDVRSLLHALLWGQKKVVTTLEEAEK